MTVTPFHDKTSRALVDTEVLAAKLGISERSVQRLAQTGRIPHYRAGRQLRFDIAEALAALRVAS